MASLAHASSGEIWIFEASIAGDLSRRSAWLTLGKSQYIMKIPEKNHHENRRQNANPIQR